MCQILDSAHDRQLVLPWLLSQFSSEDIEPIASFRSSDRVSVSTTGDGMDLVRQCGLTSSCAERPGRGAKM